MKQKIMGDFTINLEKQLNRLGKDIQQMVGRIVPLEDRGFDFIPDCDIIESNDEFKIVLDVPGLMKKEINITVKDFVLTVKGERLSDLEEGEQYRRQERLNGLFSRSFALPENVQSDKTEAHFRNGVLTISMPKIEAGEDATNIPIK